MENNKMKKITLIKSTFLKEVETKKKLCDFIMNQSKLSMGEECLKFERNFSSKQKRKYSVFVSNGSCANLLLLQSLMNMGKLKIGDKVLFSSLTWATNVMPIIQLGLKPIPLDCEINTLNVSSKILEKKLEQEKDIKCLFLTNALGFCDDLDEIDNICKRHNIIFLEDNCESLGSEYKNTLLGNFGIASTFSFFVGHHLSTIEGGMITTDDEHLYEMLVMARSHGWSRNNSKEFILQKYKNERADDFYELYNFYELGFNFRPTEINGFIGNEQIKNWNHIIDTRELNFKLISKSIEENPNIFNLELNKMTKISNFGVPLIFKTKELYERYLELFIRSKIEVRPIIGGDITKQPFFKKNISTKYNCENSDFIHRNGFYIGNNPELNQEEIERICNTIQKK
jgi:CDP-4-dehydro-6-deoxyglucose reductase, E1